MTNKEIKIIKEIIDDYVPTLFYENDYIDSYLIDLFLEKELTTNRLNRISKLFNIVNNSESIYFNIYFKCIKCGNEEYQIMKKTKFLRYIKELYKYKNKKIEENNSNLICKKCEILSQKEQQNEIKIIKKDNEKVKKENTDYYISQYLNPNNSWKENIKIYEKWNYINVTNYRYNLDKIKEYIINMGYSIFLNTPYWKVISLKVKYKSNFKCSLCNSNKDLRVHHRSYEHHGLEHLHLEDLICLCEDCHKKFHNIENDKIKEGVLNEY